MSERIGLKLSRRNFCGLLPVFASAGFADEKSPLASKAYPLESLPVRVSGAYKSRHVLQGLTHGGFPIEVHESELAPGAMPHPPHHHVHEEMFFIREGKLEITVGGETTRIGPGSAAFVASNDEHSVKNVGTAPALYFVVALGSDS